MGHDRTLILCVDRDDDIGYKGGIASPVIGRDACLDAAKTLGLEDPEDSDVNAIFQAVRVYDQLYEKGEDVGVAIVSGHHTDYLEGDRQIAAKLESILEDNVYQQCILVTDGAEDEFVLPIIQSRIPVSGIQRVVVKQMPNLEGTYYIIKKLFEDPRIARQVLVPLGIAMLLYAVAYMLGYPEGAVILVIGVIGIYLLFKGFGIDEIFVYMLNALKASLRGGRVTFVSYISAILLGIVGIVMGLMGFLEWYTVDAGLFYYAVSFLYGSVIWFTGAGLIAALGKIIDTYLNEKNGLGKVVVFPFFLLTLGMVAYGVSIYTLAINGSVAFPISEEEGMRYIIMSIILGLISAFLGVYIQRVINQWLDVHPGAFAQKEA